MKQLIKKRTNTKLNCRNRLAEIARRIIRRKFKISKVFVLILLCFLAFSNIAKAQEINDDAPIKIDTLLLTLPLTVSDKNGRNVPGLKKENFSIFQNGEKQEIEYFFNEEAPMNVAIVLDTSFSTKDVLSNIQRAARDFVKILRPEDKAVIISFDTQTLFLSELTSDRRVLTKAIDQARISEVNGSDMHSAVLLLANKYFNSLKGRKAIIVLTDGMVVGRGVSAQQVLNTLQKSDTLFYPIIFKTAHNTPTRARNKKPLPVEILEILADETAGRFYEKDATKLKEAFQSISEELKKQYLLGFYPQNTERGRSPGHVRVAVDRADLAVRVKKKFNF
jgi:Ca-activated chloride channel family protein